MVSVVRAVQVIFFGIVASCASTSEPKPSALPAPGHCAVHAEAPSPLPGTSQVDLQLSSWLGRLSPEHRQKSIFTPAGTRHFNSTQARRADHVHASHDLLAPMPLGEARALVQERLAYVAKRLRNHHYTARSGAQGPDVSKFSVLALSAADQASQTVRLALADAPLRCGPFRGALHKSNKDLTDRNSCSTVRAQDPVQTLAMHSSGMLLVRTRYAMGFLDAGDMLSPALSRQDSARLLNAPRAVALKSTTATLPSGAALALPMHTFVALAANQNILVGTAEGLMLAARPSGLQDVQRAMTRGALLEAAFSFLSGPYGFGGQDGGRDCSRFLMDLFGSFGIDLPRHSAWQAKFGTSHIDLALNSTTTQRLAALDSAQAKGAVLLYFPGHIMLYLGRNRAGIPMAIHALGEYVEPCKTASKVTSETVFRVGEITVSDLSLGHGSSRQSLLERMTRLVILAEEDTKSVTSAASCAKGDVSFLLSPQRPKPGQTARVIAVSRTPHDDATIHLQVGEQETALRTKRLGGPPYGFVAEFKAPHRPQAQHIFVKLKNGNFRHSCAKLKFNTSRLPRSITYTGPNVDSDAGTQAGADTGPTWNGENVWNREMESLWSIFVEHLFDTSPDDGQAASEETWSNLHSLLRDPSRNVLLNHLGRNEDARLRLTPDCADLPYMLRAYFAWKLDLPFAFRRCTRGRERRPPTCSQLITNLEPSPETDDVIAFRHFANHVLKSGVHSASGRTGPDDSATDFYPVPLTREALAPGTIYADPYGHVMMLAKWKPQSKSNYGVLIAAEAQPDGTIGRRRFWEGSFLFDPDTRAFGAGFKNFRPLKKDKNARRFHARSNGQLVQGLANTPFSKQQYEITPSDFYEHMDTLINPAPLDPSARQLALIDALEESVLRRVLSVQNSVDYFQQDNAIPIDMPNGRSIFQTTGPWEDYSTPSRDMRLLIAIDTVTTFPARVSAHPERYVTSNGPADPDMIRKAMRQELRRRKFTYTRSDGSAQTLTLANLIARKQALEMAYNPNDCVEIRWGAAPSTRDFATCLNRAPEDQRVKMTQYRPWFSARKRPTGALH